MEVVSFEKSLAQFDSDFLFVIDYSFVVNIQTKEQFDILTNYILDNQIRVAVSREFYENYEVIIQSLNEEQKEIAKTTSAFLEQLQNNECLLYMSDIVDSKEIVSKLNKNPKVCFVYYKDSEFSENVIDAQDTLQAKVIVVNDNGEMDVCIDKNSIIEHSATDIDTSVIDDDYFSTSFEGKEKAIVKTRDDQRYQLGKQLGSGGEGSVYDCINYPDYVVKVYHKGQLNKLRLKKIFLMEKKQISYDGLCWPEKVVFSEKGEPVGYIMKKIRGKPLSVIFDGDENLLNAFPDWKKQDLISLAVDILQKIQYLHLFGIIVGDLRLKNIVISEDGRPCLVDIDSCQIGCLPCPIGFPDFTPPELQHVEFKKQLRTYYNESFSCAVLVFKLLFCGLHPYNQRFGSGSLEENISSKSFPYPENAMGDFSKIPWGGYDEIWRHTPVQLQTFFYEIFKLGFRYNVQEMILMLKTYYEFLNLKKATIPSLNEISFNCEYEEEK